VTEDEIADVHNLKMQLSVNGQVMQNGNSNTMVFNCYFIVYYLSQFMTLEAGDLISTGTPPGVGLGMKPPVYLKAGDVVELSIEGLGSQQQVCVDAE
jgi:2,4-didehydro-3-deoxy-L-rhamnonate hydrolase